MILSFARGFFCLHLCSYEPYIDGMIPAYFSLTGSFSNVSVINQFRDDAETNAARH